MSQRGSAAAKTASVRCRDVWPREETQPVEQLIFHQCTPTGTWSRPYTSDGTRLETFVASNVSVSPCTHELKRIFNDRNPRGKSIPLEGLVDVKGRQRFPGSITGNSVRYPCASTQHMMVSGNGRKKKTNIIRTFNFPSNGSITHTAPGK